MDNDNIFIPTPESMRELDAIAAENEVDPMPDPDTAWIERKEFILGHDLHPIRGTVNLYFEPESETIWWKSPKGWSEIKVWDGKHGRYSRLSVGLDLVRELAGCG